MTQLSSSPESNDPNPNVASNPWRNRAGRVIGTLLLTGGLLVGVPKGYSALESRVNPTSGVVAGVPGQVEGASHKTSRFAYPPISVDRHWLLIEQCPPAVNGAPQPQINPALDQYNPLCVVDWVRVSGSTYSSYPEGSMISFSGEAGKKLHK